MNKIYDASQEHKPFEKTNELKGRHPRTRTGATAKLLKRRTRQVEAPAPTPAKKKK